MIYSLPASKISSLLLLLDKVNCCTSRGVVIVNGCVKAAFSSLLSSCITYSFYFCSLDFSSIMPCQFVFGVCAMCLMYASFCYSIW